MPKRDIDQISLLRNIEKDNYFNKYEFIISEYFIEYMHLYFPSHGQFIYEHIRGKLIILSHAPSS